MTSTDAIVIGMCLVIALSGVTMARLSKKQRGAGIAFAAIGILIIIGYLQAPDHAPRPGDGSPTPDIPFAFPAPTEQP
ncbi:MAG: hypothetical protein ACTHQE_12860 [Thermomicrobiales bacterium]|jgi:hypothetical protein